MFCENCGYKLKESDNFCESCGNSNRNILNLYTSGNEKRENPSIILTLLRNLFFSLKKVLPKRNTILILLALLIMFSTAVYLYYHNEEEKKLKAKTLTEQKLAEIEKGKLESLSMDNLKAVVNILCESGAGGSGTILSTDGLILTNNHVIENSETCFVTLPDRITGSPVLIYESKPVALPSPSEEYDIGGLQITASFTDEDGVTWGEYPSTFPEYTTPSVCKDRKLKLGDIIKIYGYPVTSGGLNLTVTDGILSSFSDDGHILTSAKIDNGNSGGLAVDAEGCYIGIPSAVVQGNYQNFGVIISQEVINKFLDEIP